MERCYCGYETSTPALMLVHQQVHDVTELRLELAAQQAHAEAQAARIETLEEQNAKLKAALIDVMSWIDNWSPDFTEERDWIATDNKQRAALAE